MSSSLEAGEPLIGSQNERRGGDPGPRASWSLRKQLSTDKIALGTLFTILIFSLGVATGRYVPVGRSGLLAPAGDVGVFMEYNTTFSQAPSPESDAAWESLFPTGNGFVQHATIAPVSSGLVVYHGLHCLNSLRIVYFAAIDPKEMHLPEEHSHLADPGHVQHCIDYLRQSLMCTADTNLEPVGEGEAGVTGYGYTRTCRDFNRVKKWASENWAREL
ncbi:hypothetical protein N7492_004178 [Penicillium capsulatum]|uniref:Oxidase ustYa n=1 Tax=Penicillium capsulatum TaxID=69766 RepID=A0A9W9LWZ2_9EURO|nr:hypothetical protein N7492_004178 [Penicillium capsulatum]KAJ6121252.1 hypothetical protein N7512_003717 [Penicillium capsulatum]